MNRVRFIVGMVMLAAAILVAPLAPAYFEKQSIAEAGSLSNTAHCDYLHGDSYGQVGAASPNSTWGYASISPVDYVYGRQMVYGGATSGFYQNYIDHIYITYSDGSGTGRIFPNGTVKTWSGYFPAGASRWFKTVRVCYQ